MVNRLRGQDHALRRAIWGNCWALLYQQVCRFLTEHMVRMLRRESDNCTTALNDGRSTPYNPAYPFDYLFYLATTNKPEGNEEKEWWRDNFVDNTTLIITGVAPVSRFVNGGHPIADSHAEHLATAHSTISWALAGEVPPRRPVVPNTERELSAIQDEDPPKGTGPKTFNEKLEPLCIAYQTGHCQKPKKGNPAIRPKFSGRRHPCEICLARHPASACDKIPKGSSKGTSSQKKKHRRSKHE